MVNGIGIISGINININLSNFVVGIYFIIINDDFGNDFILIQEVIELLVFLVDLLVSDYNGFNLSCDDGVDGIFLILFVGGVLFYIYVWSIGVMDQLIVKLEAGSYMV